MHNIAIGLLVITVGFIVFCFLMLFRNKMISSYRCRAVEIASKKGKQAIDIDDPHWRRFWDEYDSSGSYDSMLFALTKWRFKDFYPGWEDEP